MDLGRLGETGQRVLRYQKIFKQMIKVDCNVSFEQLICHNQDIFNILLNCMKYKKKNDHRSTLFYKCKFKIRELNQTEILIFKESIWIYFLKFRNCQFYTNDSISQEDGVYSLSRIFLNYANFFEYVFEVSIDFLNDSTLYDDESLNLFRYIYLLDLIVAFEMKDRLDIVQIYLSLLIEQHMLKDNYLCTELQIHEAFNVVIIDRSDVFPFKNYDLTPGNEENMAKELKNIRTTVNEIDQVKLHNRKLLCRELDLFNIPQFHGK